MTYQAKNNAFSTLAGSLTDVATTLTVQAGHGDRFPVIASPSHTVITLEDASGNREIVKVTARVSASDSMTIVRAQEGTTARAWASGDSVELRMTAGEVQGLFDHVDDTAGAHAASAIANTPSGNMAATTVQGAIDELQTDVDTREKNIHAAGAKTTPVDADEMGLVDSAASFVLTKITWANIKATLKTYFDELYTDNTALNAHVNDATAAHAASAISYAGSTNLAATDVEAALDELDTEKHPVMASATQAEMEAGTETANRAMSPSRVAQAIAALGPPATGTLIGYQVFTASGTYTKATNNPTFVIVEVVGGGGGGGKMGGVWTRSGGSGGGYSRKMILASALSSSETVTVGAGGAGGSANPSNGNAGGTTSFGAQCSATGGAGGSSGINAAGEGSGGDLNLTGQITQGSGSSVIVLAPGGASLYGNGGGTSTTSPGNGSGYGGGGGGLSNTAGTAGSGSSGIVIVWEYA